MHRGGKSSGHSRSVSRWAQPVGAVGEIYHVNVAQKRGSESMRTPKIKLCNGKNPLNWNGNELTVCVDSTGDEDCDNCDDYKALKLHKDSKIHVNVDANCGNHSIAPGCSGLLLGEIFWTGSSIHPDKNDGILLKRFTIEAETSGSKTFSAEVQPFQNSHVWLDSMLSLVSHGDLGNRSMIIELHAPDEMDCEHYKFVSRTEFGVSVGYKTEELENGYMQNVFADHMDKNAKLDRLQDAIKNDHVVIKLFHKAPISQSANTLAPKHIDTDTKLARAATLAKAPVPVVPAVTTISSDVTDATPVSLTEAIIADLKLQLDAANMPV